MALLEALAAVLVALLAAAFLAGIAGSFLGIGGGIFLIPFMTLVLGMPLPVAVGTSLVGVIATSTGAASVYVRDRLTNLRLGMFLEIATTWGALLGAFVAVYVEEHVLFVVFAFVTLYAATTMFRHPETARDRAYRGGEEHPLSRRLGLSSLYYDLEDHGIYRYRVERPLAGIGAGAVSGGLAGLLGLGGGFVLVPAMNLGLRVPMKAAVATSNFVIGVTAAASAFIYFSRGLVDPTMASMVILGVYTGTYVGTRLMAHARAESVRAIFAAFLVAIGGLMALRAAGVISA